ncbi:hypothetical protein GGS24DRAFT_477005 [Hypoxylon argillaceum]|nr:hypothetical protein GGS24DRAFT_477005 [Hypoxylon argillaceum]
MGGFASGYYLVGVFRGCLGCTRRLVFFVGVLVTRIFSTKENLLHLKKSKEKFIAVLDDDGRRVNSYKTIYLATTSSYIHRRASYQELPTVY